MATRENYRSDGTAERWTNEGVPGYYTGTPLAKQRDLTAAEAADLATMDTVTTQGNNAATLQQQARTAMVNNRTYTALASPSTAQNTAQIKALSQQINGVIRLLLGQLDATN